MTPLPEAGWEALRRLGQLKCIKLAENHIGHIPMEGWQVLRELTNLTYLHLGGNMTGIPEEG
jgi:hypothetical protein